MMVEIVKSGRYLTVGGPRRGDLNVGLDSPFGWSLFCKEALPTLKTYIVAEYIYGSEPWAIDEWANIVK